MSMSPIARPAPEPGNAARPAEPPLEDQSSGAGMPFAEVLADLVNERAVMQAAKVFNEQGFFHGVAASAVPAESVASPASIARGREEGELAPPTRSEGASDVLHARMPRADAPRVAQPPSGAPLVHETEATEAPAPIGRAPFGRDAGRMSIPASIRGPVQSAVSLRTLPASPGGIANQRASAPAKDAGLGSSGLQKRIAVLVEAHLRRANAADKRVEVRLVEDGLRIVAPTEKLDSAERKRLLTDVETLLARHGRGVARILLNGAFASARKL